MVRLAGARLAQLLDTVSPSRPSSLCELGFKGRFAAGRCAEPRLRRRSPGSRGRWGFGKQDGRVEGSVDDGSGDDREAGVVGP